MKKKNILLLGLVGLMSLVSGLTSCSPDYETDFHTNKLEVPYRSRATVALNVNGGSHEIAVNTNIGLDSWKAESNSPWCVVEKREGKVVVSADKNEGYKTRKAVVTIYYGHQKYNVEVRQLGKDSALEIIEDQQYGFVSTPKGKIYKEIDATTETITVPLHTNLDVTHVIVPDTANWVTYDKAASTRVSGDDLKFGRKNIVLKVKKNTRLEERYCTVTLQSSQNWDATTEFVIKQGPRGFIVEPVEGKTTYEVEDLGEVIKLPFSRNGNPNSYEIVVPTEHSAWLKVAKTTRTMINDSLMVTVEPNEVEQPRTGTFVVRANNTNEPNEFTVTVNQKAFVPVIPNNVSNLTATPDMCAVTLNWQLPEKVNFSKIVIEFQDGTLNAKRTIKLKTKTATSFKIDKVYDKHGAINFKVYTEGVTGLKAATPVEVTATPGAFVARKRVDLRVGQISSNANNPAAEGNLANLLDNNTNTFHHSNWAQGGKSNDGKNHNLIFDLSANPIYKSFAFNYKPRANNANGDVKKAFIYVSEDGATWRQIGEMNYNLPTSRTQLVEPVDAVTDGQAETVKYIKYEVRARRNKDDMGPNDWFFMSELELYEVFGDEATYTSRAPEAVQEVTI